MTEDLLASLSPKEREILPLLNDKERAEEFAQRVQRDLVEVMRTAQFLQNKQLVTILTEEEEGAELTELGKALKGSKLPEEALYEAIGDGLAMREVAEKTGLGKNEIGGALGRLKDAGAITLEQGMLTKTDKPVRFVTKELLTRYPELTAEEQALLKSQGLLAPRTTTKYRIELTKPGKRAQEALKNSDVEYAERVTPAMLKDGSWKEQAFRTYDVTTPLPPVHPGREHFVQEAISHIKQLWLEMGFTEMTGTMTQTAFWDMDALFVPQDHPAREEHDTFYLDKEGQLPEWWGTVKEVHENGGDTGSAGWEYSFSEEETKKVMLRTHTTALSAQMLKRLDPETDLPAKFFSVSKVFRNETLDWKHLAEFHQVEGIVVGEDLSLADLIGLQKEFYSKMGFTKVRFRPFYFPYTEPSAEVEVYHPGRDEWLELGGMGVFRPEVVKTLLGKDVPVLAWGLGMERIITRYWEIKDLRDIYSNDLQRLRSQKRYLPEDEHAHD